MLNVLSLQFDLTILSKYDPNYFNDIKRNFKLNGLTNIKMIELWLHQELTAAVVERQFYDRVFLGIKQGEIYFHNGST